MYEYAVGYWSTACFWLYLSSYHSCEEIKCTYSHITHCKLKKGKFFEWLFRKYTEEQIHFSLEEIVLSVTIKLEILPYSCASSSWEFKANHKQKFPWKCKNLQHFVHQFKFSFPIAFCSNSVFPLKSWMLHIYSKTSTMNGKTPLKMLLYI